MCVAFRCLGKVLVNLVLGLEWYSGWVAAAGRAGDLRNFRKESVGILNDTQRKASSSKIQRGQLGPLCPGPRAMCKIFRPTQLAGKESCCGDLAREALRR